MKAKVFTLAALIGLVHCSYQDDGTVEFSDTERAIIKTLIYTDPADDLTSNYDLSTAAQSLGQKFFWDKQFSGEIVIQGNRTSTFAAGTGSKQQINCVTCHNPSYGWADNSTKPNDVSLGANFTSRNSPTILNAARNPYSLWDGAADSIWAVARPAIEGNPHNFYRTGVAYVICNAYKTEFEAVFGTTDTSGTSSICTAMAVPSASNNYGKSNYAGTTVTITNASPGVVTFNNHGFAANSQIVLTTTGSLPTGLSTGTTYYVRNPATNTFELSLTSGGASINTSSAGSGTHTAVMTSAQKTQVDNIFVNFAKAIGAYERLIVSKNSAFDQFANGSDAALTVSQKRGLKIFIGKGNCIRCHSGSNFSDGNFHNLGVPQVGGYSGSNDQGRYDGITTLKSGANAFLNTATSYDDSGTVTDRVSSLAAATSDIGKFKTPTLRSVSSTGPYFHNGTFASLWDVVNFYNFAGNGGNFPGTKDTILTTRRMTNEEMEDLVNFLNALDGESLSTSLTSSPTLPAAVW